MLSADVLKIIQNLKKNQTVENCYMHKMNNYYILSIN